MPKLTMPLVLFVAVSAFMHAQAQTPSGLDQPVVNRLIAVGPPKVYDDLYLTNQLNTLRDQLASITGVDKATLLSHIGVAQGADLRQSSFALSGSGPPTPATQTFTLAPGTPAFSYPPGYTGASPSITAYPAGTATATTPGTQTTVSSMVPTAPTPPAPSLTVPAIPSLGQSSLAAYNESLQLSAEIINTSVLLNGAFSDTIQRDGQPKTTLTIGFPITIEPPSNKDHDLENAVAEVQVTICSNSNAETPSIVTLLPRERTYNIASLVDKSFLGSASAILGGVANVGGSFLWGHKTYYLVQQQETVAFLRPTPGCAAFPTSASFAWQIHPVLGKKFIRPGNTVNFVQLSVPKVDTSAATFVIGEACVTVLWRRSDSKGEYLKSGAAGQDENGEDTRLVPKTNCFPIYYYNLPEQNLTARVVDIGSGAVNVEVRGWTFLPGTNVRLGNTYSKPDTIAATHDSLTFTAPATAIVASDGAWLVGRDNRQWEIVDKRTSKQRLEIRPEIESYSDTQSLVKIHYQLPKDVDPSEPGVHDTNKADPAVNPWVVVIGGKVFGLSDSPFLSSTLPETEGEVKLIVPTSLLQGASAIEMRRLLWRNSCCRDSKPILLKSFSKSTPTVSKASILSSHDGLTIGLVGSGLDQVKLVLPDPTGENCRNCAASAMGSTFLVVTIPKPPKSETQAKVVSKKGGATKARKEAKAPPDPTDGLKQLVFCRTEGPGSDGPCSQNFPRLVVDVPKLDAPAAKPKLDDPDPVPPKTAQISITGSMLDQVVSIEYAKVSLGFRISPDKTPGKTPPLLLDISKIPPVPGGYPCLVTFADKTTAPLTVTIK